MATVDAVLTGFEVDEERRIEHALASAALCSRTVEVASLMESVRSLHPSMVWLAADPSRWNVRVACEALVRLGLEVVAVVDGDSALLPWLIEAGVSDIIERPINERSLAARIGLLQRRQRARAQLRGEVEQFRSIITNIPGTVYRCEYDQGWTMLFINDEIEVLSGHPAKDFLSGRRDYADIMHPDDRDRAQREVGEAIEQGRPFVLEYRVVHVDGSVRWVSSRGQGVHDGQGELRFIDGAIFDVTETKRLQQRLIEQREQLTHNNEELSRLHELKNRMFQNVSHELRTPLSLILAPLEQMLRPGQRIRSEHREHLEAMQRHGLRLLGQINDILDLAKFSNQRTAAPALHGGSTIDVRELSGRLIRDVVYPATLKGVSLQFESDGPPAIYRLDPRLLEKILLNLLSNALKFTPTGGTITVTLVDDPTGLVLSVLDTGIGIDEQARARIFNRFEQADASTTRSYGGTGIGLALVSEIVASMGGTIDVTSAPGEGSCFTIGIPAVHRALVVAGDSRVTETSTADELARRAALAGLAIDALPTIKLTREGDRGPRILLAEDDPSLNKTLVDLLKDDYRVTATGNGLEALRLAAQLRPHVIVSDVMMPGMDGLELVAALREQIAFRETPIVLLSAKSDLQARVEGRRGGADSYLTKPFSPRELLATIEGLLRSRMRVVGSYLVHELLGTGGQAEVHLAEELESGELVALKIILANPHEDPSARERLAREQQALARLQHPNIVRIVEQGEHNSRVYIAMEYLDGFTLKQVLNANKTLSAPVVASVGLQVASALVTIHRAGLVHRDIKDSNIMVLRGMGSLHGRIKLIDFGVAYEHSEKTDGAIIGTLPYLAPELLSGGAPSIASDVYALGVVLFRCIAGALPYHGDSREEMLDSILRGPPTQDPLDGFEELSEIVLRAMAPQAEDRWPTAEHLHQALSRCDTHEDFDTALKMPERSSEVAHALSTVVSDPVEGSFLD